MARYKGMRTPKTSDGDVKFYRFLREEDTYGAPLFCFKRPKDSYGVQWERLFVREMKFFDELGISVFYSGLHFTEKISEMEMLCVGLILMQLEHRTEPIKGGNHIYFAIGQWFSQVEEWYGEDASRTMSLIIEVAGLGMRNDPLDHEEEEEE